MKSHQTLTIDGIEKSYREWAEHSPNLHYQTIYERVKMGWQPIHAVFTAVHNKPDIGIKRAVEYQGKVKPLSQWTSELGLDYSVVYSRLYIGNEAWSVERAFTEPIVPYAQRPNLQSITYKGETKKLSEWADTPGIHPSAQVLRYRLKQGWSPKDILYKPVGGVYRTPTIMLEYQGETRTLRAWSELVNIPYMTLYTRMKAGWSTAATLCTKPKNKTDD